MNSCRFIVLSAGAPVNSVPPGQITVRALPDAVPGRSSKTRLETQLPVDLTRLSSIRSFLMEGAPMSNPFWLSDEQLAAIEAALPKKRCGVKPQRNREVISGIIHVLKIGCRWEDCPPDYGPHTTVYNRLNRWPKAGIWSAILAKLVVFDAPDIQCIDNTTAKAHRCAAGGKGGTKNRPLDAAGAAEPRKSTRLSMEMAVSSGSN